MATVATKTMTAEEFYEWANSPDNADTLYELVQGEPVPMPTPSELHGVICSLIAHLLWRYVFQRGKGYVCSNDTGLLVERDPDTLRGPDVMLFDELRRLEELSGQFAVAIPRLVVEVLSPSDRMGKVNRSN